MLTQGTVLESPSHRVLEGADRIFGTHKLFRFVPWTDVVVCVSQSAASRDRYRFDFNHCFG